jgi:predicted SnoaL-like aldol condensation-catalyzing enzyme
MVPHDKQSQIAAVEAFLTGLTRNSVEAMPFADDILLTSPLAPEHPARGRKEVVDFLENQVFPNVPVAAAKVERHIVEGDAVATLWQATFRLEGRMIVVPIFDFFRVTNGLIHEIRPYFDPKPLKEGPFRGQEMAEAISDSTL